MTKTVAITGATGTLGRATTNRFPIPDWKVWACSLNGGVLSFDSHVVISERVDVTLPLDVKGWLDTIGKVDALVTCAGVSLVKSSLEMSSNEFRSVLNVNLKGTFLAVQEAVKHGATRVVTVGSIHGSTPTSYPERAAYTASKAGVVGLTQALAVELGPKGVAINCVAPGHLPVLMDGTGAGQELLDAARAKTPTGRLTTPEEVAEVVYWLCNDAPMNLTGQVITVSGGFELNTWPM